jgi:Tol biopolymer transport system component
VNPFDPPRLSAGGSVIAFATTAQLVPTDQNGTLDVYVQNVRGGAPELASVRRVGWPGHGRSGAPSISADGRYVAFESDTRSLTKNDDDIGITDVFVRDRVTDTTTLVSVTPKGHSGNRESSRPDISPDGTRVAFQSFANDLTKGDKNTLYDVYVRDLKHRTTTLASALPDGSVALNVGSVTPAISDNGLVVFDSSEAFGNAPSDPRSTVRDQTAYAHAIVLRDLRTGKARVVSDAEDGTPNNGLAYRPDISSDGRFVSFESSATNLVDGDGNNTPGLRGIFETDVFVRDLTSGQIDRASVASDGTEAGAGSSGSSVTRGGLVAYESGASNLVARDDNGALDAFVSAGGRTSLASAGAHGSSPRSAGYLSFGTVSPSLSASGRQVAFASSAPELTKRKGGPLVFGAFVRSLHPGGRRYGPFGIGCRDKTFAVPVTGGATHRTDRAIPVLAASGVLAAALAATRRRTRTRLAAALALCIGVTSVAVPASAHHYSPIQPGGPMLLESDPNGGVASANFVFRDRRTRSLYIGTAAHVTRGLGAGTEVPVEGVGKVGRLVYSREGLNTFSRQDFALVKIDPRRTKKVDPAVRTWGGPTGVAEPRTLLPGTMTYQYGQGAVFRHTQPTRAKAGPLSRIIDDEWGWMGWYLLTNWSFGGDSGSPILTADGKALGVTITLAAPYGESGWSMGPTLALIMQELRLVGFDVELVTAPWNGPAGDVAGTVEHCTAEPIDDGPLNDGCVRPHPEP